MMYPECSVAINACVTSHLHEDVKALGGCPSHICASFKHSCWLNNLVKVQVEFKKDILLIGSQCPCGSHDYASVTPLGYVEGGCVLNSQLMLLMSSQLSSGMLGMRCLWDLYDVSCLSS
eukprot:TRINITY_DN264_c0_g1_i19.p1 TRINITY_DN264_c0_g1~~TRINITY_DN264_c0_g1_i19.p1  ORF type:complete len:119 (+),score=0.37 TRINITY_DN264_c0_g1_i19:281-637(+)